MSRAEPFLLTVVFAVFIAVFGGLPLLSEGLYLDFYEGDTYHLLDILTRMGRGDVPHLDFMTPLGVLGLLPIHLLMQAGVTAGTAIVLAQIAVAACLLPVVAYAASSRLRRGVALYFGLTTLGLVVTISYGTATAGVGISMHYNRWAWAVSFALLLLALVPAKGRAHPLIDGTLIGALGACLLVLKITYFVVLVPVAALLLWQMHGARGFLAAIGAGLVGLAIVTVTYGLAFWGAYIHDLQVVAGNDIRPFAGLPLNQFLSGPVHITETLLGIAAVLILRQSLSPLAGVAVLLMIPGFFYITFQNFGNDPKWLLFLPVILLAFCPARGERELFGFDLAQISKVTTIVALAAFFPSAYNTALAPIKHASFDKARFLPMLPEPAGHQDIFVRRDRAYKMTAQIYKDQEPGPWARYEAEVDRPPVPEFEGVSFPYCQWQAGSRALLETLGEELSATGLPEGSRLFTTDLVVAFWFFAPVAPPEGSAPWYYDRLSGLENSDYVMVPKCAFAVPARNKMLEHLAASDAEFTLVRDTELATIYKVEMP